MGLGGKNISGFAAVLMALAVSSGPVGAAEDLGEALIGGKP